MGSRWLIRSFRFAFPAAWLTAFGPQAAVQPRSPHGIWLRHGAYVESSTPCGRASNATLAYFDGRFYINQLGWLNARPVPRRPNTFTAQIDHVRDEPVSLTMRIVAVSDREFTAQSGEYPATRYRICPQAAIPEIWRGSPSP